LFETTEKNNHEIHRTRARHLHIQLSREIKNEVKQIGTYQEMTRTSKPHLGSLNLPESHAECRELKTENWELETGN
jgi:hypothetical protein